MSTATKLKSDLDSQIKDAKDYKPSDEDRIALESAKERLAFLKENRKSIGIEEIWMAADRAYVPHKLSSKKSKGTLVSNDELGWRSSKINLNSEDAWQEEGVSPNPYIKIQTALGIIVDRNPTAVFNPGASKFESTNLLMKNLYERSWKIAKSKDCALKPVVFNAAKYGLGIGRTFPLKIDRSVRDLIKFNPKNPRENKYNETVHTYYDDVFRESLSPWQVWFDDASVQGNPFATDDVIYCKDYDWLLMKEQFSHLKNFESYKPKQQVLNSLDNHDSVDQGEGEAKNSKYQERVWFWESLKRDTLFVWTDSGVVLVNEPMPQSPKNKRLSVWNTPWTMRDDKSIYGIGIYEAMRNDHQLYTKVRNMTMDQLVLSIYREFFYSGTNDLENNGVMKTHPGKGRQVSDSKDIKWNEVPGPGQEAWMAQEKIMDAIDNSSGISKSLEGEVTGSTAFEISQARESALKRLKTPLDNIADALEDDAYISCGIFEDLYSLSKIKLISEDRYIEPFELAEYETEDGEELEEGVHFEMKTREFPLFVEKDDNGKYTRAKEEHFITLSNEDITWEGIIEIEGQSVVAGSELLERTTTVEMANLIVPLFQMPREIAEKPAKEIIKSYDKDVEDWFPDAWLQPIDEQPTGPKLFQDVGAEEESPSEGLNTVIKDKNINPAAKNLVNSVNKIGQ